MRSASNTTLVRGRHRLGLPGLVPVTSFVEVVRRNFFVRMFRTGRHRHTAPVGATVTVLPTAPTTGTVRATELTAA